MARRPGLNHGGRAHATQEERIGSSRCCGTASERRQSVQPPALFTEEGSHIQGMCHDNCEQCDLAPAMATSALINFDDAEIRERI